MTRQQQHVILAPCQFLSVLLLVVLSVAPKNLYTHALAHPRKPRTSWPLFHVHNSTFTVANNQFVLDGNPIILRSGSLHYFRIPPSLWEDRILRLKAMGLNAISTYIPWNFHETNFHGTFYDFTSPSHNLPHFLSLITKHNMLILLRIGPYICAEWDFGGLPVRLLANAQNKEEEAVKIRTYDETYIAEVTRWWDVVLPLVKPFLLGQASTTTTQANNTTQPYSNNNNTTTDTVNSKRGGGSIVMVQIENEYGSFGNVTSNPSDLRYMQYLVTLAKRHLGEGVVLYTTDGGNEDMMRAGSLQGGIVLTLGDFGPFHVDQPNTQQENPALRAIHGQNTLNPPNLSPPFVTEFYPGWLTHWGEPMANTSTTTLTTCLSYLLHTLNMSFNLYMAHGGTNFGFWNGAHGLDKMHETYSYEITSYDYNAPIMEGSGGHNLGKDGLDKFLGVQEVLKSFTGGIHEEEWPEEPTELVIAQLGYVAMERRSTADYSFVSWIKSVVEEEDVVRSDDTWSAERLGQRFGMTLYSTTLPLASGEDGGVLDLRAVSDRAQVYVNGHYIQTVGRNDGSYVVPLPPADVSHRDGTQEDRRTLDIVVENMGHINGRQAMYDPKGLLSGATYNNKMLQNWTHYPFEWTQKQVSQVPLEPIPLLTNPPFWHTHSLTKNDDTTNVFYSTTFELPPQPSHFGGTHVDMRNFTKGIVWVNGWCLGRYWTSMGPQYTLFVPSDYLYYNTTITEVNQEKERVEGVKNSLLVFEMDGVVHPGKEIGLEFVSKPRFGWSSLVAPRPSTREKAEARQ